MNRLAVLAVLVCSLPTFPQQNPNLETGFKPFGSYDSTQIDSVDISNGNLFVHIPLFTYPQRGSLTRNTYAFESNNKNFYVYQTCNRLTGVCQDSWKWQGPPHAGQTVWIADMGGIRVDWRYVSPVYLFTATTVDGSSHQLAPISGRAGYETIDGTGIFYGGSPNNTSDSRMINRKGDQPGEDANGNLAGGVDTLGRTIPASTVSTTDYTGCAGPLAISGASTATYPSPNGGSTQVKACYVNVPIQTSFQAIDPQGNPIAELTTTASMVQTIAIYDGASWATSPKYTIEYGNPYADITKITLPTNGTISYTWGAASACNSNALIPISRILLDRTVDAQDGTGPHTTSYRFSIVNGVSVPTAIDPQGNETLHYLTGVAGSCSLYETQTQYYQGSHTSGTLLKTVQTDYSGQLSPFDVYGDGTTTAIDVHPIRITTTWPSGLVNKVEHDYDANFAFYASGAHSISLAGNPSETREYDYGQGAPGPLLRRTDNTYQAFSNANYLNANFVDLLSSSVVYDGSGTQLASTGYGYDEYGLAGSGITTQRDTSVANPGIRGNQTSVRRWLNTTGGTLTTTTTYFDSGMPYQVTDPGGHTTTFTYSSAFAGAYPTQTQMPDSGSPAIHHVVSGNYDFNSGLLTSFTGQNGEVSSYNYDGLFRMMLAVLPNTDLGGTHGETDYIYPDLNTVETRQRQDAGTWLDHYSYFDGLGRVKQNVLASDPEGTVKTDTTYDGLGRLNSASNAYRSTADPTYGTTGYHYDALDRVTAITKQDGNTVQTTYAAFPTVVATDESGNQRRTRTDALGRLVEVDEPRSAGDPIPNYASMQSDGNFVVYGQSGQPLWWSQTSQSPAQGTFQLAMQVDGNAVVYNQLAMWSTNSQQPFVSGPYSSPACDNLGATLSQGQHLNVNSCLVSPAGRFKLVLQSDGNFVLYDLASPVTYRWASGTSGQPVAYATIQSDGNLVLYTAGGAAVWASNSQPASPSGTFSLTLQDDGNGVIYNLKALWWSNTVQVGSTGPYASPDCNNVGSQIVGGQSINWGSCLVSTNGRFKLTMQSDGNLVLYDLSQNPAPALWSSGTSATTPLTYAYVTQYAYDALGNLTCVEQHGNALGTGCAGSPSQDASSPWRVRRFTYDSLSRLLTASNPETGTVTYSYAADTTCNPGGENLRTKSDARGFSTTYCYDQLHRVTQKSFSDGTPAYVYRYDLTSMGWASISNSIGRLVWATNSQNADRTVSYDAMGRVINQWGWSPASPQGNANPVTASYDAAGHLSSVAYPSARLVNFQYNGAGRLQKVYSNGGSEYDFLNVLSFWPAGAWNSATYGNGTRQQDSYNNRLQPSELKLLNSGNGAIADRQYVWTGCTGASNANSGNVCNINDALNSNHNQTFRYDGLNRLISGLQNDGAFNQTFSPDPWGNVTIAGPGGGTSRSYSTQNRDTAYGSDVAGNLLNDGANTYVYNAQNEVTSVTASNGGNVANYVYDAEGNRVRKNVGSSWTEYLDFGGNVIAENGPSGWTDYIFADGKRIAQVSSAATQYYWADSLGTTKMTLDAAGNSQCAAIYTPFGSEVSGCPTHYKFTGKERDSESNLDDFGARYYSSTMGRFMSPDWSATPQAVPYADLNDPQTLNLYGYVRNNPLSHADADGHCCDFSDVVDFLTGAANAYGSDNLFGAGRMDQNGAAGRIGAAFGDAGATIQGAGETLLGAGGEVVGGALDATGIGALVGVPVNAVSTGLIIHGTATGTIGGANLIKDANQTSSGGPKADQAPGVTSSGQATDKYGNKLGPSGEPQVNTTKSNTREAARNKALNEGSGAVEHKTPKQGDPHFHPTDTQGKKKPGSTHHEYPD